MRTPIEHAPTMTRIASSRVLIPPWPIAAASAARFAATARAIPTIFRTPMVAHALSSRVPAPARLRSLVSALHGRLAVVNPARAARLPAGLMAAVHGLVRIGFDGAGVSAREGWEPVTLRPDARGRSRVRRGSDPRRTYELRMVRALLTALPPSIREQLSEGMAWGSLALYESSAPTVRLTTAGETAADTGSPVAVAVAEIRYRLAVIAGSGSPDEWHELDGAAVAAPAIAWPLRRRHKQQSSGPDNETHGNPPWLVAPLLVPDAWLSACADPETLARWASLTGRSGAPDRYWFPDTWDRFLEPGRRVGWLTANDVWRHRRGRLPSATEPGAEDEPIYGSDSYSARPAALTLTPDLERGVGVPPGYALVRCVGTLEVAVVVRS